MSISTARYAQPSTGTVNKIAEVTFSFWILKILATTLGESTGDLTAQTLNLGWRFDYQSLTPGMRRSVRSARLPRQPRFSQHAPLIIDYDWTLSL